ncbi:hypothetical protein [Fibrisoma limi]|uniref:hypothetical protein n=1 Tax=Fibrisoma limi TaxID=663275 RepID=UPI001788DA53|nr:hypothetical protein [Fibrisoma limi]
MITLRQKVDVKLLIAVSNLIHVRPPEQFTNLIRGFSLQILLHGFKSRYQIRPFAIATAPIVSPGFEIKLAKTIGWGTAANSKKRNETIELAFHGINLLFIVQRLQQRLANGL